MDEVIKFECIFFPLETFLEFLQQIHVNFLLQEHFQKAHFYIEYPVQSIKQFYSFVGAVTIGTQTSLTDLSNLNRITQVQTIETQTERFNHHIAVDTTTTTSVTNTLTVFAVDGNIIRTQIGTTYYGGGD